ncbi:hypothetical protein DDW13_06480 [Acidianus hospitalis]|uniref:DUF3800 domain-containing protein n=1 Tax=Acidianus hospitalis TaxID=563177 RepID=A0A2T9X3Q5_9CREN|nr:hypothetical protein DDW13_06480 [Acidianus hospitalis]
MKSYFVFVDESYRPNIFALSVVWTKNKTEPCKIKNEALKKIGKENYRFHFKNDDDEIRKNFMNTILNSSINFGIILTEYPSSCSEYARYYIAEVINNLPIEDNSRVVITIKGINDWINKKKCKINEEVIRWIRKRIFYTIKFNDKAGLEIADYIASAYTYCKFQKDNFCELLENKLTFLVRIR